MSHFYDNPKEESTLRLGKSEASLILVSNVAVIGTKLANGVDKQRKKGANFGRLRFLGIAPAEFDVTFVVLPEEEEAFWRDVAPLLRQPGKNGTAPPLEAVHPQINRVDVSTITVVAANIGQPTSEGLRMVSLQLIEWTPKPVKAKDAINIQRLKVVPVRVDYGVAGLRGNGETHTPVDPSTLAPDTFFDG